MKKTIAKIVLPVLVATAALVGIPASQAIDASLNVTSTDTVAGNVNSLTLDFNTGANALEAGDTIMLMARDGAGAAVAFAGGDVDITDGTTTTTLAATYANDMLTMTVDAPTAAFTLINTDITLSANAGTPTALDITNPATDNVAISIITNTAAANDGHIDVELVYLDNSNEVVVTAIVEPTLSMDVTAVDPAAGDNAINLGVLSDTQVTESMSLPTAQGTDITISTNAAGGYVLNAQSLNTGLDDGMGNNIASARYGALAAGTEGFAIRATAASTAAIATANGSIGDGSDAVNHVAVDNTSRALSNAGAPANAEVTQVEYAAAIDGATPIGSYSDTITYTVTGNF